jgi:DNA-binding SARP family transcriptional activator
MTERFALKTLGGVGLTGPGGPVEPILAGPKRVAVLAYLAIESARSLPRRETLLGLFWPESDEPSARNALRNTIHALRRSLSASAIVTHGAAEVGLDPNVVACDAVTFAERLSRGDLARALEVYGGDFLPGLYVSGCAEFDRWVETRRAELRSHAAAAAAILSDRGDQDGELETALAWARRASELAPYDESALRRRIGLHRRSARAAARRAARSGSRRR